ncbi:von Willebrand factor A domain-containing protein 3B-like isoform X2 [Heterodontus francisci]|uniref:von Willebrand factor A domain-containing protein 3B-like isoform X2 n=1 Tax=Heterodontus francisci TaxID=7792 RepID=UPI00355BC2CE
MMRAHEKNSHLELDVRTLLSSSKWLQIHGLKRSRLTLSQILSQIGFKRREEFDCGLRKPVSSCYGEGLFHQYMRKDGRIYNLTASKEQLQQFAVSLTKAIRFYQRRLEWLTSGSKQLFGVIQERCIVIVLDFACMSQSLFHLSLDALCMVLQEQVALIGKVNLIRAAEEMVMWQDKAVPVTAQTIDSAIDWIRNLHHMPATSKTSSVEAVLQATSDNTIEAVYLFAAGDGPEEMRELLRRKLAKSPCPVHTVSFNAKEEATIRFLKELADFTAGRFHAFAPMNECEEGETLSPNDLKGTDTQVPKIQRKLIGGVPPGAGVREDVFLIWSEIEEARNTLAEVHTLLRHAPQPMFNSVTVHQPVTQSNSEDYITSKKWLERYGLKARRLSCYDALADCAFRHSDGVVDIKGKPVNECMQTDAETRIKLVNAKYCGRFAHTQWKDGSVMHVYISAEKCKQYQRRMKTTLDQIQRRIDWLQQGSRELFGTIIEDQIYVLVDTSQSMNDKLELVQRKIFQLMQEQIRHKTKFNFVKFDSIVEPWQEKLAEVNENNLESAWSWVKGLQVGGSTNTLGAVRLALADAGTQAIYLLTDGRPDQPPKTIFAQVQLIRLVPIHSIAFNCDDVEANEFLYELSEKTGGRFHSYNSDMRVTSNPPPFVSEDISLLKKEMEQGRKDLERVEKLYAECVMLDWYHNSDETVAKNNIAADVPIWRPTWSDNTAQVRSLDVKAPVRPKSAVDWTPATHRNHRDRHHIYSVNIAKKSKELQRKKVLHAAHTKSSLLRSLSNGVKIDENLMDEWMLPENKELFVNNYNKELKVLNGLSLPESKPLTKKARRPTNNSLDISSAHWLKTNSLIAKRLTIMDALAPTAVAQTAKYVPVLDKHIMSKVFDEVLPLAHVSNSKMQITLINPLGVNLENYKQRLFQAIQSYEKRLNLVIWRALSQEERDKFSSDKPISFADNKEALLQALDRMGWPIPQEDVTLLEDEIQTGYSYEQQASDLQKAAKEKELGAMNHVPRSHNPSVQKATKQAGRILDSLRGQRVIARSEVDGFYYPGIVTKRAGVRKAIIDFTKGDTQITPTRFLIQVGGAAPCPPLKVGDFILVRSDAEAENDCYLPGVVIATPNKAVPADKFYTVLKYNNTKGLQAYSDPHEEFCAYLCSSDAEHSFRSELIKISKMQYTFINRYIREAQMIDRTIPNVQFVKPIPKPVLQQEVNTSSSGDERHRKKQRKIKEHKKHHSRQKDPSDADDDEWQSASGSELGLKETSFSTDEDCYDDHKSTSDCKTTNGCLISSSSPSCTPTPTSSASQPHSLSQSGALMSSRLSTPLTPKHFPQSLSTPSTEGVSPGQTRAPTVTSGKLEELRNQLQQALTEQRKQQEVVKEYLKELVNLKENQINSKILQEQKDLARQQMELLKRLEKLSPSYSVGSKEDQKGKASGIPIPEDADSARLILPKLILGQNVLAQWSRTGWYDTGSVIHDCGDHSYFIQSSAGEVERIWREDIFTHTNDVENIIQEDDPVIGLHPLQNLGYCPGIVLKVQPDFKSEIRYYDGVEALVPREELYLLCPQKFERDVAYILECEECRVGQPVVARHDETGTYQLAQVHERVGDGKKYLIHWANGQRAFQSASFIFGQFSRHKVLTVGDCVLAVADSSSSTYLPGVICDYNGPKLVVHFCNGKCCQHQEPQHCFWLSEDQFQLAVEIYNKKNRENEQHSQYEQENYSEDESPESNFSSTSTGTLC